ncbi:DUF1844 domain-containing protein [Acidicapsa dinghuensis]|uniref:DUF1844 domain-containing protein n=1 Tax=Acidicapsa dinghuensis TaxID=2218256 RepID=A0ABW1EDZ4_9BACT|nr:DUF1844 domain-containing protein [Acidicapsa dinghuensis]
MSDTPKFTVVDRRKFRADDDAAPAAEIAATPEQKPATPPAAASSSGPRLVERIPQTPVKAEEPVDSDPVLVTPEAEEEQSPLGPTEEEISQLKDDYSRAADRIDDLIRAQNPGAPAPEKIGFEHLVQQLYLSALMQMGAGTPEGQRPRVDILGARQTIDLLGVLESKCKGNLTAEEARSLEVVLFELRATFLELTRMISAQPLPPPPGGVKR